VAGRKVAFAQQQVVSSDRGIPGNPIVARQHPRRRQSQAGAEAALQNGRLQLLMQRAQAFARVAGWNADRQLENWFHQNLPFWPFQGAAAKRILASVRRFEQAILMNHTRTTLLATVSIGVAIALSGATTLAADSKNEAVVKTLLTEPLSGIPGKEVTVLTVEYLPGGASMAHRHDADVFVYVLEGAVVMQVDGKEPVTVRKGQTFRESPKDIHRQSANASKTEPARFVVFVVKDQGKPVTRPLDGG
jgi:quercetin dioxygenase-like cupin family protein